MPVRLLTKPEDFHKYTQWVSAHAGKTLWQSEEWKRYQESLGREVRVYILEDENKITASALAVIDKTALGLSTWNVPRGPVFSNENSGKQMVDFLLEEAKKEKCITLYISPIQELRHEKFFRTKRHEQPEATLILDLAQADEKILEQMKQKGRYNIRLAEKNGVTVEQSKDVQAFYQLMKSTGERDAFGVHSQKHYEKFLMNLSGSFLLIAYESGHDKKPIAGLIGVIWGNTGLPTVDGSPAKVGIYYYGASSYESRSLMAPYALQWAAMKHCKLAGCTHYDLLGIAPPDSPENHAWQGITGFKEKFGGTLVTYPAEQEAVLKPLAKTALTVKRKILG